MTDQKSLFGADANSPAAKKNIPVAGGEPLAARMRPHDLDEPRVALDEIAARLDLVAHEHREDRVRLGGVLDRDHGRGSVRGDRAALR